MEFKKKKKATNPFYIIVNKKNPIVSPEENDFDPVIEERAKIV